MLPKHLTRILLPAVEVLLLASPIEKRHRLFDAIGINFEVFLLEVLYRSTLVVHRGHINRDQICIYAKDVLRVLLLRKDFSWSFCRSSWILGDTLRETRHCQGNQHEQ